MATCTVARRQNMVPGLTHCRTAVVTSIAHSGLRFGDLLVIYLYDVAEACRAMTRPTDIGGCNVPGRFAGCEIVIVAGVAEPQAWICRRYFTVVDSHDHRERHRGMASATVSGAVHMIGRLIRCMTRITRRRSGVVVHACLYPCGRTQMACVADIVSRDMGRRLILNVTIRTRSRTDGIVSETCRQPGRRQVTDLALVGRGYMVQRLSCRRHVVVTSDTVAKHVVVIHRGDGGESNGVMTGVTCIRAVDVVQRLARTGIAHVAPHADVRGLAVVHARHRREGGDHVAGLAVVGGQRMGYDLSDKSLPVVAKHAVAVVRCR